MSGIARLIEEKDAEIARLEAEIERKDAEIARLRSAITSCDTRRLPKAVIDCLHGALNGASHDARNHG
jgi:hypothetical protein